jgi:hypothetical protein
MKYYFLTCILLSLLAGCSGGNDKWKSSRPKTVLAGGVVTLDGKPLEAAQVVFVSSSADSGTGGSGLTDADGNFELSSFPPDKGIPPGTYQVMIVKAIVPEVQEVSEDVFSPPATAKLLVPVKYTTPTTSGLTVEIPEEGKADIALQLTGQP